jgi:hypothetical protein
VRAITPFKTQENFREIFLVGFWRRRMRATQPNAQCPGALEFSWPAFGIALVENLTLIYVGNYRQNKNPLMRWVWFASWVFGKNTSFFFLNQKP